MVRGPWHLSFYITFFSRFTLKQHSHKNHTTYSHRIHHVIFGWCKILAEKNHKPSNRWAGSIMSKVYFLSLIFNSNLFNDRKLKGKYTPGKCKPGPWFQTLHPFQKFRPNPISPFPPPFSILMSSGMRFPEWKPPAWGLDCSYGGGGITLWLPSNMVAKEEPRIRTQNVGASVSSSPSYWWCFNWIMQL